MIRINLLPVDQEVSEQAPIKPAIPLAVCALLPFIVIFPLHFKMKATHTALQEDIVRKRAKLDELQSVIRQVQELENAKTQLNNRKNVIKQLENERLRYPMFMDDFLKLLPGNLWLTSLSTIQKDGGGHVDCGRCDRAG